MILWIRVGEKTHTEKLYMCPISFQVSSTFEYKPTAFEVAVEIDLFKGCKYPTIKF